ncbi:MAG: 16S rRNA (cytidine(1402)-2'-O)-methyltransferase [Chloroflexi bacterium]|nr:16S rRNA (cytidine(1402)-2'-O)-methyltransferase [Chloroflexota bacterium]
MLYLVATPIGNLGDITLRAIETLREVDLIASEDTRKTGRLLKHLGIDKPQLSFYEHNEEAAGARILEHLLAGKSVALVTSAGTPGIADPGFTLVRRALAHDVPVTMIPGPTAFVMAAVLSGLPVHSFTFRGFTPRKRSARLRFYQADVDSPYTLIYYESPHRLLRSLQDALKVFGDRPAAVANDLTKLYERVWRGTLAGLVEELRDLRAQGEFVLVIGGRTEGN